MWGSGAHWREEHRAHQQIVSLPGDAAVKALGAIVTLVCWSPWEGVGQRRGSSGFQRQTSGTEIIVRVIS